MVGKLLEFKRKVKILSYIRFLLERDKPSSSGPGQRSDIGFEDRGKGSQGSGSEHEGRGERVHVCMEKVRAKQSRFVALKEVEYVQRIVTLAEVCIEHDRVLLCRLREASRPQGCGADMFDGCLIVETFWVLLLCYSKLYRSYYIVGSLRCARGALKI